MTTSYLYNYSEIKVGWNPNSLGITATTQALNAAATWAAFSFVAPVAGLSAFMVDLSAVTGSPIAADITAQIYANAGAFPGSAVGSAGTLSATPATGWNSFTGISSGTLTIGETYWVVIKNGNATPASNSVTLRCNNGVEAVFGSGNLTGPRFYTSTNSGTAWSAGINSNTWRAYDSVSDTYWGFPASTAVVVTSGERVQGTTEIGCQFKTPVGVSLNTRSIAMMPYKLGTVGNLGLKLYDSGGNLLATSVKKPLGDLDTSPRFVLFKFSTTLTLTPNTTYHAMMFEDGSSTGSNYYQMYKVPFNTDSNSDKLRHLQAKAYKNVAGTFSEITGYTMPLAILLSANNEFAIASGGGPSSYMVSG